LLVSKIRIPHLERLTLLWVTPFLCLHFNTLAFFGNCLINYQEIRKTLN
jgi:hypothetical protein